MPTNVWKTGKTRFSRSVTAVLAGAALLHAADAGANTLRFDDAQVSLIHARRWDETHIPSPGEGGELFFDGVHRFLLLRFPGSAEAIYGKLREGRRIESAHLDLHWSKQEFLSVADYLWRGRLLADREEPEWHARAWLLRRPWIACERQGPTWNAYVHGAGYWSLGGARCPFLDRFPEPLGDVKLSSARPRGSIDVTAALTSAACGASVADRLRSLEDHGFLLDKVDPERTMRIAAIARMWVEQPVLRVVFRETGEAAEIGELSAATDVRALANGLTTHGEGGVPSSRIPDNLAALSAGMRKQPDGMPDWMWARVREIRSLRTRSYDWINEVYDGLESHDEERFRAALDLLMRVPPGYDVGHFDMDMLMPLTHYGELLPEAVRYHIREYFAAQWTPPYDGSGWPHRFGGRAEMGTLNLEANFRTCAVLVGETLSLPELTLTGRRGLEMLNRQRIYHEGVIEERGDSYYLGITMAQLQALSRFSEDPLTRLKASLAIEKILFEINATYHPGLRRRVSPVGRRQSYTAAGAPLSALVLAQDVPRAVLHTLSRKGVLIETDREMAHGVPVMGMGSSAPARVARLAPWGKAWEANAIDGKPIPFLSVSTDYVRGGVLSEPIYNTTFMGTTYALASANSEMGFQWPVLAAWRRVSAAVERLEELGLMFPWGYANGQLMIRVHPQVGEDGGIAVGPQVNPLSAALQHRNRMIYVMRPPERAFLADTVSDGLQSLSTRMHVLSWGDDAEREFWVNGQRIEDLPVELSHGDAITMRDGVSFLGLIPIPATDLGRDRQVWVRRESWSLILESFMLDRAETLPDTPQSWEALSRATAGWVVELGSEGEHDSFPAFRERFGETRVDTLWDAETRVLHVACHTGGETLEMGVNTAFARAVSETQRPVTESWAPVPPSRLLAYQRVNGQWPWPDRGIDLDCPLGQMGKTARLEKAGATLTTAEGQMALLRVEPVGGVYIGINPFIDPTPFELTTPEGMIVRSEGALGLGRIALCPSENRLWIDCRLPPPNGDRAAETLQQDAEDGRETGYPGGYPLRRYFRPETDVRRARELSARALLFAGGGEPPRVVLNGEILSGPFASFSMDGRTWHRIPLLP